MAAPIFNHHGRGKVYLEQAAGSIPRFRWGARAGHLWNIITDTVTLRVAGRHRAHESTAALPADMALFERLKELRLKFAKRGRACVRYFHRRDAARHERPKAAHDIEF